MTPSAAEDRMRRIVEDCFRREAGPSVPFPLDATDLIETGLLDSMGWVGFLRSVELASGAPDLGFRLAERSPSIANVLESLRDAVSGAPEEHSAYSSTQILESAASASIAGSASAVGSRITPSEEVDRAFGMPAGKLRHRAGIESLAYAADGETELTLGARTVHEALHAAALGAQELDWIIATSETHHDYPSLSAQLHSRLLVRESCGALDVGGACLGLLNALFVAQAFILSGRARVVAVVTADVHSRILTPGRVSGEFGGLFGDGASAFILRSSGGAAQACVLGGFFFGCAGQYSNAINVANGKNGLLCVRFDGEALSRAAINRMEKVLTTVELRSGIPRAAVGGFATHQPNARLVALLAREYNVSSEAFPPIARTSGNLGSSTCGVALHAALQRGEKHPSPDRRAVFLASLGPGLLFGGGWLTQPSR